jgi:hypothetical protein
VEKQPSEAELEAIQGELYAGRKIQAIKLHRQATGQGLKESKDAVEAMTDELRARFPERFDKISSRKGCMPVLMVSAGAIVAFLMS